MGKLVFTGKFMNGEARPFSDASLSERETLDLLAECRDPRTHRACHTILRQLQTIDALQAQLETAQYQCNLWQKQAVRAKHEEQDIT